MEIVIGNFLLAVGQMLGFILSMYIFLLLGRVIVSWVNADPYNPIVKFLILATEPPLRAIRKFLPRIPGPIDFTPMVLLLIVYFLQTFLVATIMDFGAKLKHTVM
jgi:YggT family protein